MSPGRSKTSSTMVLGSCISVVAKRTSASTALAGNFLRDTKRVKMRWEVRTFVDEGLGSCAGGGRLVRDWDWDLPALRKGDLDAYARVARTAEALCDRPRA